MGLRSSAYADSLAEAERTAYLKANKDSETLTGNIVDWVSDYLTSPNRE